MNDFLKKMAASLQGVLHILHQSGLRTRFTLLFYLITLFSVAIIGYFGYTSASSAYHSKAVELVAGYTAEAADKIDTFEELTRNDLDFLGRSHTLLQTLYWEDMHDDSEAAYWRGMSSNAMAEFAKAYGYYYKIRFINTQGHEQISIKRNTQSKKVEILSESKFENQKDADYFLRGMKLQKGEYYASTMSLNMENGEIEKPIVPVVHFVSAVIGDNGTRYGVLVANIFAEAYYKYLREANRVDSNRRFYLVNGESGEYFFHSDESKGFAQEENFNKDFPGLLSIVKDYETQTTLTTHGKIMSFRYIHPNIDSHENGFILVGMVDESVALSELNNFIYIFILLVVLVIFLVLAAARYYVGGLMAPLAFVTKQLERLGRGETGMEHFEYHAEDEITVMLESTSKLLSNMENLASLADTISKGEFSKDVPILSAQDRLGNALGNMTKMLRNSKLEDARNNWLKDGISQLSRALTGDLTPQKLADAAISLCGRYLEVGRGVFYVFDKNKKQLELLGSYMFTEREALNSSFKLGIGAVGQVALEKKPISLNATQGSPIITGTLSLPPSHTYTYPLLREGELLGVVELASFEHFDELKLEFLNLATEVMASFLYIAEQREEVNKLLNIAEEARRQADEQSAHLQEANSLMEEQQQQLEQQTEELQQSNTQMEEQQQQLQQQTEELQQSNTQMEEQQQQLQQQSAELKLKNDSLVQVQDELRRRANELEETNTYKSEFLANMSHELRTPLNAIILLSKMLSSNDASHLDEEEIKKTKIIHDSGSELLRLINDILDISKVEAGKMDIHLSSIATSKIAEEMNELFGSVANDKGVKFIIQDKLQRSIVSDKDKLSQILRNLLSNSFKFTKEGFVTLWLEDGEDEKMPICIKVEDTGIGIPQENLETIFEAFKQVDGTITREYGGTGLGLSIVSSYAKLLGGKITAQSQEGRGSLFTLLLPGTHMPDELASDIKPEVVVKPKQVSKRDDSSKTVLIVDDDKFFAKIVEGEAKKLGLSSKIAHSGKEALSCLKSYKIDAVVLDLGLPDMDGVELLKIIRSEEEYADMPVYIISARDKANEDQLGISGFLQKPVDTDLIDKALGEMCVLGAQNILIIEENDAYRETISKYLQKDLHLECVGVDGTDNAMKMLQKKKFDIIIMDVKHSDDDVGSVCSNIHKLHDDIPIILLTTDELTDAEEFKLKKCAKSIILKKEQSEKRMADELKIFLQHSAQSEAASQMYLKGKSDEPANSNSKLKDKHILVVDDDMRNIYVLTSALEKNACHVLEASNGKEALKILSTNKVDLVLMDIMMPEMDGYEAIRAIREDKKLNEVPVIALTAKALKDDREKCISAGADDYLAKPVEYDVLISLLSAWIDKKHDNSHN